MLRIVTTCDMLNIHPQIKALGYHTEFPINILYRFY